MWYLSGPAKLTRIMTSRGVLPWVRSSGSGPGCGLRSAIAWNRLQPTQDLITCFVSFLRRGTQWHSETWAIKSASLPHVVYPSVIAPPACKYRCLCHLGMWNNFLEFFLCILAPHASWLVWTFKCIMSLVVLCWSCLLLSSLDPKHSLTLNLFSSKGTLNSLIDLCVLHKPHDPCAHAQCVPRFVFL